MRTILTRLIRSTGLAISLFFVGVVCLWVHFEIYRRTSASAFINQPEFYFRNVCLIRDASGQVIREVSYATGFFSYITAFTTVVAFGWDVAHIVLRLRR